MSTKYLPPRHSKPTKTSAPRAWLRARKEIAAGMPLIPKQVADRIASGENALRALREWRGKTQLDIAHKTNIGQGYISDLESGRRNGTTAALKKIADVLKVPLDLIV
jgi:predicted transcriptional regulator